MSSPLLHFYDMKSGEFQSSRVAQQRPNGQYILDVQGATAVAPPEVSEKQAACWDGHAWQVKEDHRQKLDKGGVIIEGSGTDFWLPGDDWRSPARHMEDLGPLPEGAVLEKPAKPKAEADKETRRARMAELESWFRAHDYIGIKIATGRASAEDYAEEIALMNRYSVELDTLRAEENRLSEGS